MKSWLPGADPHGSIPGYRDRIHNVKIFSSKLCVRVCVTTSQTACTDVVGGSVPPRSSQHQIRRVSADNLPSSTSRLSQSELYGSGSQGRQPAFYSSRGVVKTSMSNQNAGHSSPKRRSSDQPYLRRRTADGEVPAQMPKQRANSVHAVIQNSSGVQSIPVDSQDRSGNAGQDSFPFVVPLQRVQPQRQQTVAHILRSKAGTRITGGRMPAVDPSSEQRGTEKISGTGADSVSTKHVTFTDQKVCTQFSDLQQKYTPNYLIFFMQLGFP